MNDSETYHAITEAHLWRYFAGEASGEERELLATWVQKSDVHKSEFHRVKELFYSTTHAPMRHQFDSQTAFSHFQKNTQPAARTISLRPWMAVAAMVAVLLGTGIFFMTHSTKQASNTSIAYTYSTQKANYTLPDQSLVQLNKHSQVQYQLNVTNKRSVVLTGEAYFDVKHNAALPFEIAAGTVNVKVLGTAFNVNARNSDSVIVSVTRGKVKVSSMNDSTKSIYLTAGQSSCFVRNSFCEIKAFPLNVLSWKERTIDFEATPMTEVVKTLGNYFDTTIILDSKNSNQQLTVKLKEPKLDSVLELLKVMYNLKSTKNNQAIVLKDSKTD